MRTYMAKPNEVEQKWFVVDAKGISLGRLASSVATILRGKNKPQFTPGVDCGDHVIILNADQVELTGRKREQKVHYTHSLYPGGLKAVKYSILLEQRPEVALTKTVWGMLPHNRLGRQQIKRLKVYRGTEHPHQAQKPETLEIQG